MAQMDLEYRLVRSPMELAGYRTEIFNLFQTCFNRTLEDSFWKWAYLENVFGEPYVSLCFDKDKLVGHYALVPFKLGVQGEAVESCISITTMVDNDYILKGVYKKQAEDIYQFAKESGVDLIYGFPNKLSAPGLKKRLKWTLHPTHYVAPLSKAEIISSSVLMTEAKNSEIGFNLEEGFKWRLSKPGCDYYQQGKSILKNYGDEIDLVYLGSDVEEALAEDNVYNVLIPSAETQFESKKLFDYQFGYKILSEKWNELNFKVDLILSDVF